MIFEPSIQPRDKPKGVICHITTVHPAMDVRIFHKECRTLVQAGYEVHLVAPHDKTETVEGVQIHPLPMLRGRLRRMIQMPLLAFRAVRRIRPRPVVCHFHDPELLPMAQALRLAGLRMVFDVHENVAQSMLTKPYIPRPLRPLACQGYRLIENIFSRGMATVHVLDTIAAGYRSPKVTVRNLPDVADGPAPSPPGNSRPVLIYCGGVCKLRGSDVLLNLAAELNRRNLDFEMRLVGEASPASLAQQTREWIDQHGLADKVKLVGKVPYHQAQVEIAAADIGLCLLTPAPNYLNSLPVKLLEYMMHSKPSLVTDIPCWRQYVTDIGAGLMVQIDDIDKVADAAQKLMQDRPMALQMGQLGRQAVINELCWQKEKLKLLAFYDEMIRCRKDSDLD